MKVAILTPLYPSVDAPAQGSFIRDQARALDRSGIDVIVLHVSLRSPRGSAILGMRHPRPLIEMLPNETPPVYRWRGWSFGSDSVPALMRHGARQLLRSLEVRHRRPDVVHGHFSFGGGDAASLVATELGAPLILTEHSSEFARGLVVGRRRAVITRVVGTADAVIAVSRTLANDLERITGCAAMVIPNIVDVDAFPPRQMQAHMPGGFHIVSVGSLHRKKGYDLLIHALAALPHDGWYATIVGQGTERNRLRGLAEELGVASRIEFTGVLSRDRIRDLLGTAAVFVSSSRQETFGVAVAEALSVGVPAIVTPGGATTFVEAPYGLVVPAESGAISAGIARVMHGEYVFDPATSHARIRSSFGPEAVTERIRAVYTEVTGRGCS